MNMNKTKNKAILSVLAGTLLYVAIKLALPEHSPTDRLIISMCLWGAMLAAANMPSK